ncbi:MAG: hypothetical protein DDT40_01251 [candidate division WS2 bacterium]|uniref:Uncharacterized protein n=1 Tax=Psychracetigena formicireducens TaxID=2986056 RepID=A0A9E2BHS8_PSYF1|nr:hypothetical protein [Candidatus Psychracetigena formicireducens]MBT9145132.1 hypothetical protein [Candidatus Psychracetigena formicireducens]MBT9151067.1 hypothetical protein [Candidatus Psychracetigena formicireducens]
MTDDITNCCQNKKEERVPLTVGSLSLTELEALFTTIPAELTFVDKDDYIVYYNEPKTPIFPRNPQIIGTTIQACHSEASIPALNKIIELLKSGVKDSIDSWRTVKGRLIYIKYMAARGKNGNYAGMLEFTMDITDIKKVEGERSYSEDR